MILPAGRPQVPYFIGTPVVFAPAAGRPSSKAGLLRLRQFERHLELTSSFTPASTPNLPAMRPCRMSLPSWDAPSLASPRQPRFRIQIMIDELTQTDLNTKIEKHFKRVK
jgi:hypothetical protein